MKICILLAVVCTQFYVIKAELDKHYRRIELYNAGTAHQSKGEALQAIHYYQMAIEIFEEFPEAHQNLGVLYDAEGNHEQAMYHHEQSIRFGKTEAFISNCYSNMALSILSTIISPMKEPTKVNSAQFYIDQSLRLDHQNFNSLLLLGGLQNKLGLYDDALNTYHQIVHLNPNHSMALLNIGNYHFLKNNYTSACEYYDKALTATIHNNDEKVDGTYIDNIIKIYINLGRCHQELNNLYKSLLNFQFGLQHMSKYDEYHLFHIYKFKFAKKNSLRFVVDQIPRTYSEYLLMAVSSIKSTKSALLDWKDLEFFESILLKSIIIHGSNLLTQPVNIMERNKMIIDPYTVMSSRDTIDSVNGLNADVLASHLTCSKPPERSWNLESVMNDNLICGHNSHTYQPTIDHHTLKIAYISHDWRNHPAGRLTSNLVTSHQICNETNDITCKDILSTSLSYGPNDQSQERKHIELNSPCFIDLNLLKNSHDDYEVANMIAALKFDILIDLTAHTFGGRIDISAMKPAPIVINYLGYAGTTGCIGVDYNLVDHLVVPPEIAASQFTEKMFYLPRSYYPNNMNFEDAPCVSKSEMESQQDQVWHFSQWNQPRRKTFLYCSFNSIHKIESISFTIWMNILRRVVNAKFGLLVGSSDDVKNNLIRQIRYHGISLDRIIFFQSIPWRDHLRRSTACDLVLDTFLYSAHTTAVDMLWMWVPILSLYGWGQNKMISRVPSSLLQWMSMHAMKRNENSLNPYNLLVVDSLQLYEDTAVRYGKHPEIIYEIHNLLGSYSILNHHQSNLFNTKHMQFHMESAYQLAFEIFRIPKSHGGIVGLENKAFHIIVGDEYDRFEVIHPVDKIGVMHPKQMNARMEWDHEDNSCPLRLCKELICWDASNSSYDSWYHDHIAIARGKFFYILQYYMKMVNLLDKIKSLVNINQLSNRINKEYDPLNWNQSIIIEIFQKQTMHTTIYIDRFLQEQRHSEEIETMESSSESFISFCQIRNDLLSTLRRFVMANTMDDWITAQHIRVGRLQCDGLDQIRNAIDEEIIMNCQDEWNVSVYRWNSMKEAVDRMNIDDDQLFILSGIDVMR